jgi:hypothetical protein
MTMPHPNSETDEIVATLNHRLRVVRGSCEWILQRLAVQSGDWYEIGACPSKPGLLLRIRSELQKRAKAVLPLDVLVKRYADPEALAEIDALPDFFPRGDR